MANFLIRRGRRVSIYDHYGRGYSGRAKCCQDKKFFASYLTEHFDLYVYFMEHLIEAAYKVQKPSSVKQLMLLASAGMAYKLCNLFNWVNWL